MLMGTFKIKAFYFLNKLEAVYIAFSSAFFFGCKKQKFNLSKLRLKAAFFRRYT